MDLQLWNGAVELGNASAIGWQANAGGQRFGIGQSTGGLYFFHTASNPGTTGSPANYDLQITDSGNISQARDKGGLVKAMVFVEADGTIIRCYNSFLTGSAASIAPCGFSRPVFYDIDFGFKVDDRFVSVAANTSGNSPTAANVRYGGFICCNQNVIGVDIRTLDGGITSAGFTIIVY